MRTAKFTFVLLCLALLAIGCNGGAKEGPDAFARMQKNKQVVIATDPVNLPFEYGAGTGVQGFDVDIGTEIGRDLGYEVKWLKIPFERLFEILANGEAELVISAISITPERKKDFAFSEPYFDSGNTIARRKHKPAIKDLASLAGKKVGVQSGTTGHKLTENQKTAANVTIAKFPTLDDALGALNRTEIEAVIGDEPILMYSIYKSFPELETLGSRLTEEQYGVVVRKSEKELLAKVNDTIARLKKSGELERLRNQWFQKMLDDVGKEREEKRRQETMQEAPKAVTFNFVKTGGGFPMSRLDGFTINLVGGNGTYKSSAIETSGSSGSCRFGSVPPGQYALSMPIFRLNTTITIPKTATRSVAFNMTISAKGIDITQR